MKTNVRHIGLLVVLALSAVLNTYRLAQNGWANIFYSAGDQSMLRSLHNFLFVSFDPGGLVTVDKPPLALWLQTASAKLFGFTPLSLLVPEAIAGVLAVGFLYVILARRLGALAAFAGALAMAVFPSFVAVSRENGVDALVILLLVLACGAALRAIETGRWRTLIWCGVLVGLAFNTKTLAAYLVVPGIALGYLVCAPGSLLRRIARLAVAGLVMAVVSFSWITFVDATPASKRPFVGGSTNNTELQLTFGYNGFGRVEGQSGGPNSVVVKPGARVPLPPSHPSNTRRRSPPAPVKHPPTPPRSTGTSTRRAKNPIPFGGPPGPLRLLGKGLGDQAGWMLPFALFGVIAVALLALSDRRRDARDAREGTADAANEAEPPPLPGRRDPRLATAIVLGGWFLIEALVLSTSKGIVHPYYVSALAPGTGAMSGAGVVALLRLARGQRRLWALALAPCAAAATVATQLVLMHREHYMLWFAPLLLGAVIVGVGALIALRRIALPALALIFVALLVTPTGYAASTWLAPVEGTFPAAGPTTAAGSTNGFGVSDGDLSIYRALSRYVSTHRPGTRWEILTVASDTAAPMMLLGVKGGALGGYSGNDPALDGAGLARYVARGEARWVLLGGEYSLRGGNRATKAVLAACKQIDPAVWHSPVPYPYGLTLFDCAGRERALAAA
ncbi:MAG TPA: glycosyltransferase family 39 protein [Solirubrobacteraceae bacterium]|nr:glycosyltransferase family 39 protein [Solirubrobacteraceae bacterium]